MQLLIEHRGAAIGIAQNRPAVRLENTRPVLKLQRQGPRLEISGGGVSVRIDQTACFAEKGLKPPSVLAGECIDLGRRAALDGIARRAEEGDFLAAVERGAEVADLAVPEEKFEVVFALLPRTRPAIEFVGEPLQIKMFPGRVGVDFTPASVKVEAPPFPYIQTYLRQEPSLRIRAVPDKIDTTV